MRVVDKRARVTKLIDLRCRKAGSHQSVQRGLINYGRGRGKQIVMICILCNRWELRWREVPA